MNFAAESTKTSAPREVTATAQRSTALAWLCPEVLLSVTSSSPPGTTLRAAVFHRRAKLNPIRTLVLRDHGSDLHLSVFVLPRGATLSGTTLRIGTPRNHMENVDLNKAAKDLKTLLRDHVASFGVSERESVLGLLTSVLQEHSARQCSHLARNLKAARDALRTRLPETIITAEVHRGMFVDAMFALDDRSFYLRGWASSAAGSWRRFTAVSPEGARVELTERVFRHARPDINSLYRISPEAAAADPAGLVCYFELPAPCVAGEGWLLEAVDGSGTPMEATIPEPQTDLRSAHQAITQDLVYEKMPAQRFRQAHVLPALTALQARRHRQLKFASVDQFGRPAAKPEASIIVPLFRRVDFLEHQLAQFAHDPEFQETDLIYVLDSPELAPSLRACAAELHELYRVPFRLACLNTNAGYAGANNLGASLARGRKLLLLNSDVLPLHQGWLGRTVRFSDAQPNLGALGVKLLYEDDTLQHAGMYFRRSPVSGLWENEHYFKGLDRRFHRANISRMVPAVSASCLLTDTARFADMGGLRAIYLQGDYEDSDYCLRLRQDGQEIWYCPEVELYHLEGQSYASDDRSQNLELNRWVHTHFWDATIEALMNTVEFAS